MRKLAFTVKLSDCDVQTFSAGGPGGQNQNRRSTGVRIIHHPSGAVGEARDARSQLQNKRAAFVRMGKSCEFQLWAKIKAGNQEQFLQRLVDEQMRPENLVIEYGPPV